MKYFLYVLLAVVIYTAHGVPTPNDTGSGVGTLAVQNDNNNKNFAILSNTGKIIEELVMNLRKAIDQAGEAIATFKKRIQEQFNIFNEQVNQEFQKVKDNINQKIEKITERFTNTSAAVKDCVNARQKEISEIINTASADSTSCANNKIAEVGSSVDQLKDLAQEAHLSASESVKNMKACTEEHKDNMIAAGKCLGTVVIQTELKQTGFAAKSGLMIAGINFRLATLPVTLEGCAASNLMKVGVESTKILGKLGACSATNSFSAITGNYVPDEKNV